MTKIICFVSAIIALFCWGYLSGAYVTRNHYTAEIADYKLQAEQQYSKALEANDVVRQALQDNADQTAQAVQTAENQIKNRYQALLDNAADYADSLQHSGAGAGSESAKNSAASTSGAVPESSDKRLGADRSKLQRLYRQQLTLARDCDITATHYNALIDFYDSIKKSQ